MKRLKISEGGQVSVPSDVRHRWRTRTVVAEDHGDHLVIRPVPDDPVAAARGALRARVKGSSQDARRQARADERHTSGRRSPPR